MAEWTAGVSRRVGARTVRGIRTSVGWPFRYCPSRWIFRFFVLFVPDPGNLGWMCEVLVSLLDGSLGVVLYGRLNLF